MWAVAYAGDAHEIHQIAPRGEEKRESRKSKKPSTPSIMDRGTADELDAAMIGTRLPVPAGLKALKRMELVLHLAAWVGVVAAIILDGHADNFDPARVIGEVRHYEWRKSTADAALASFVVAVASLVAALIDRPLPGLVVSLAVCVAAVVKRIMLIDTTAGNLRSWCVVSAAAAAGCLGLATLLQSVRAHRRRKALAMVRLEDDLETSTREFDASAPNHGRLPRPNTYTRRNADGKGTGATVGRLLSLAGPERCMLICATFFLCGSTAASTAMPAMVDGL